MTTTGFPLHQGTADQFAAVRRLLAASGYDEPAVRKWRASPGPDPANPRLAALVRLFLAEEAVEGQGLEALAALGLVEPAANGRWRATVSLYPVGPLYLASDLAKVSPKPVDVVYPAAEQTLAFLDSLPDTPCERFLDLASGTGVAALMAAAGCGCHAWACDITARAAHFAEFNRRLNGLEAVTVGCGDLYEPVAGLRFDRIAAHPPYVPVAGRTFVYRDGGEDGEQVMRRIIQGLPEYLEPGGRFYGFGMASDREGEGFDERIRKWLGARAAEFDVLLVTHSLSTPDALSSPMGAEERAHWNRVFSAHKVKYLFLGSILVERHAAPRPCFTVRTQTGARSGWRETEWLRGLLAAAAGDQEGRMLLEGRPALSPDLEMRVIHRVRDGRLAQEECILETDYPFHMECRCHPWIAALVGACDGRRTGWEHLASCRETMPGQELTPAQLVHVLRSMASAGFIVYPDFGFPPPG